VQHQKALTAAIVLRCTQQDCALLRATGQDTGVCLHAVASSLANAGQSRVSDNAPVPEHVCDDFASRLQLSLQFLEQPGHACW